MGIGQAGGGEAKLAQRACQMAVLTEDDGIAVQRIGKGTSLEKALSRISLPTLLQLLCVVPSFLC